MHLYCGLSERVITLVQITSGDSKAMFPKEFQFELHSKLKA